MADLALVLLLGWLCWDGLDGYGLGQRLLCCLCHLVCRGLLQLARLGVGENEVELWPKEGYERTALCRAVKEGEEQVQETEVAMLDRMIRCHLDGKVVDP